MLYKYFLPRLIAGNKQATYETGYLGFLTQPLKAVFLPKLLYHNYMYDDNN